METKNKNKLLAKLILGDKPKRTRNLIGKAIGIFMAESVKKADLTANNTCLKEVKSYN